MSGAQVAPQMHWSAMLVSLRNQKEYLEGLLCKTATTLHVLRDKQTRNERALAGNPAPAAKRKKIRHNQWRTSKTIKTCEHEEAAVLDYLRVCNANIMSLEAILYRPGTILYSTETSSITADNCWSDSRESGAETETSATDFDWNGWADDDSMSPFERKTRRPVFAEDIAPETPVDDTRPKGTLTPHLHAVPPPVAPRQRTASLSAAAPCFNPRTNTAVTVRETANQPVDKLSISGLLASKRLRRLNTEELRRFLRRRPSAPVQSLVRFAARWLAAPSTQHECWSPAEHVWPRGGGEKCASEHLSLIATGVW
ncbi:hypothetical protein M011DRAFT_465218 [Sporormia fimetaria CBS 119925]|uniref:Uncharacterized protein n=1 Tax=Sporormia fimetaria CBS 119925 TaxID=1340428 RepID=A0A6A6VKZ2_9PLEO|nr:hypothetical protein M011DRAFT_465218 [Sporormia fimetaria CBS 119925]